jgi:signal transduction histidine kinase
MLIDMFAVATIEQNINLSIQFDDSIPDEIITDEQRIKQVLINLLQNALKFTKREGSI